MQVVIEIPEDYYKMIKHDFENGMYYNPYVLIANGTPLPKGHGDLIDRSMIAFDYWSVDGYACVEKKNIFNMPVIVPADKMETEQMLNTPMEIQNEIRDARILELIKAQGVTENE